MAVWILTGCFVFYICLVWGDLPKFWRNIQGVRAQDGCVTFLQQADKLYQELKKSGLRPPNVIFASELSYSKCGICPQRSIEDWLN